MQPLIRTVLCLALGSLAAVGTACSTKPNPKACCTTGPQCATVGLDQVTPCHGLDVCGSDGECIAPQCTTPADCPNATDLCENQMCVAQTCLGPSGWSACFRSLPAGDVTVPTELDTSQSSPYCTPAPDTWLASGQADACFFVGEHVIVSSRVVVTGPRPLVIVASTIDIATGGSLDAGSWTGRMIRGAGSPSDKCRSVAQEATTSAAQIGGGGAGGTFITAGGNGGDADNGAALGGGAAAPTGTTPTTLRAGCDGGRGAAGTTPAGVPGAGGGALYLLAGTAININGYINVSGGPGGSGVGGGSGGYHHGGSGGGSGGMIVLFAPTITAAAGVAVLAAGGAGAAPGGTDTPGQRGGDAQPEYPLAIVEGGRGGMCPNGADSYVPTDPNPTSGRPGSPGSGPCGGAGASGGAGYIRSNIALGDAIVMPPADIVP
jgi:hypothetical protein